MLQKMNIVKERLNQGKEQEDDEGDEVVPNPLSVLNDSVTGLPARMRARSPRGKSQFANAAALLNDDAESSDAYTTSH